MLGPAEMLLRHGFATLLPDARAHGIEWRQHRLRTVSSRPTMFGGGSSGFRQAESPHCIDGLGDSMGGAELLRSLDAERGFCAVIAESAFATFREAAYDRLGQHFSTGSWLGRTLLRPALIGYGVRSTSVRSRLRAGGPGKHGCCITRAGASDSRSGGHESAAASLRDDQGGQSSGRAVGTGRSRPLRRIDGCAGGVRTARG